ncbi:hypothetical protein [Picrophilus oshimae]|uniref:hypothetical protein n=1 Tax=Picrophilus oshimae TaxID=46632 RepID=UPI000A06044C|nr:hypothetical protein [Picrophilus oshimae]
MILLLQEYFKDYPVKREIIEKLFENGISVKNGKLYLNDIEISISAVAKALKINRKTVYETMELIEKIYL